jgi:hypothetical protein
MTSPRPRWPGLARQSKYEPQMEQATAAPGEWVPLGDDFNNAHTARAWFLSLGFEQTSRQVDPGNPDTKYAIWIRKVSA